MQLRNRLNPRAGTIARPWLWIGATLLAAVPLAVGDRPGAPTGSSGGRVDFGPSSPNNCTACHVFNHGHGSVEIIGAPLRYRAGVTYDVTVRIIDPEQAGAGFEFSAEGVDPDPPLKAPPAHPHLGTLTVSDPINTRFAGSGTDYITHTGEASWTCVPMNPGSVGVGDSILNWVGNGGSYDYHMQWTAPATNEGPITFFASGNAIDDNCVFSNDRYYNMHTIGQFAVPGDADGDTDVDLRDAALYARCHSGSSFSPGENCEFVDSNDDGAIDDNDLADFLAALSASGPTATLPAGYVLADAVRGGKIYDKWWNVNGAPEPIFAAPDENHPLYPDFLMDDLTPTQQAGSATFRCKECHGWDYKGLDGAYASGSHQTDIVGIQNTTLTPQALFDLLKSSDTGSNGHDMLSYGMTAVDLWDVVKLTLEGVIETDDFIDNSGVFYYGDADIGSNLFGFICSSCHGSQGNDINFGTTLDPEYVGTVAAQNPWEFLHKIRFGHPGAPMPSFELLELDVPAVRMSHIGRFAATLPQ